MNLLTAKQVATRLSCSISFVWKLTREDPKFPQPVHIGLATGGRVRGTRWVEDALSEWMLNRMQAPEIATNEN